MSKKIKSQNFNVGIYTDRDNLKCSIEITAKIVKYILPIEDSKKFYKY